MSPKYPQKINVAGQPHQRTLLKVVTRKPDGTPDKVEIMTEEEAVKDSITEDTLVAYLPAKEMRHEV